MFVFLFVDLFDNVGTLVAVGKKARLFNEAHQIPRLNRILLSDAAATIAGSITGTSTVVSYIESVAGVVAGGRSGVTSIVVGLLFVAALFVAPLVGAIPRRSDCPGLDSRWFDDGIAHCGDRMGGRSDRHSRLPHDYCNTADIQHRERNRDRIHDVHFLMPVARRIQTGELADVPLTALFIVRFAYLGRA